MTTHLDRAGGGRDPWTDRLSEYLDGEMVGRDREALEAHLHSCSECSAALADLEAVVARAKALVDLPPAEDLWPQIERRIGEAGGHAAAPTVGARAPRGARVGRDRQAWWVRRIDLSMPQLAAAGVLLVALSAAGVWLGLRSMTPTSAPVVRPIARNDATPAPAPPANAPDARPAEDAGGGTAPALAVVSNPRYDAAVAELEQALAEGRGRLDPRTLQVVEDNLRIIDRAIDEARRAVAADPGNMWLRSHLAATMKRKVDLLRSATLVVSSAQG